MKHPTHELCATLALAASTAGAVSCMSTTDSVEGSIASTKERGIGVQDAPERSPNVCEPSNCATVTPTDALVTDFSDLSPEGVFVDGDSYSKRPADWWLRFYGSPYVYPRGEGRLNQTILGQWRVQGTVADWSGFGLWLGACTVDLSAYRGISFEIGGDAGPSGVIRLFIDTAPDTPPEECRSNVGHCDPEAGACKSPVAEIRVPRNGPETVTVLFGDTTGGAPRPSVDPSEILQFHFAFAWTDYDGVQSEPYDVDVTLDDIRLEELEPAHAFNAIRP